MRWTRRDFLATAGAAISATAIGAPLFAGRAEPLPFPHDGPAYLAGDPYLATADGPGLGGRSFQEARDRALRFRTPPAERDRFVLGLESLHA